MEKSNEITDASDWLTTSLPQLAPVESALRCQVCKDFYNTPMITTCSHTFCSLCIRRCLTTDGKCPACRAPDQEVRLRRNWIVQELVDAFQVARPHVMSLGKGVESRVSPKKTTDRKRKIEDTDLEESDESDYSNSSLQRKRTRSQAANASTPRSQRSRRSRPSIEDSPSKTDGLTSCPICGARMKEEEVFGHLDIHDDPKPAVEDSARHKKVIDRPTPKPPERLPQLNYSLLKDTALRRKLTELGIPSTGPRTLIIARHAEWINLVNANCDSSLPRSKRDLLRDLDTWDRSQGRQITSTASASNDTSSVMSKDFDGAAWASSHGGDYKSLIAIARRKRQTDTETEKDIDAVAETSRSTPKSLERRPSDRVQETAGGESVNGADYDNPSHAFPLPGTMQDPSHRGEVVPSPPPRVLIDLDAEDWK